LSVIIIIIITITIIIGAVATVSIGQEAGRFGEGQYEV